jgi:sulfur transfer complex TusBCD TusB component (DsrH family)
MLERLIDYQVVIFTYRHVVTGELVLKDKRLSDHINERVDTMLNLRNVTVARLENPTRILHKMATAVAPKSGIVLIFEPVQQAIPPSNRFFGYIKKEKHEVFLIMDGMEVRGILHTQSNPDFRLVLVNSPDAFLPITEATIHLEANPEMTIQQDAILINTQRVRFIGNLELKSPTIPLPPKEAA